MGTSISKEMETERLFQVFTKYNDSIKQSVFNNQLVYYCPEADCDFLSSKREEIYMHHGLVYRNTDYTRSKSCPVLKQALPLDYCDLLRYFRMMATLNNSGPINIKEQLEMQDVMKTIKRLKEENTEKVNILSERRQ